MKRVVAKIRSQAEDRHFGEIFRGGLLTFSMKVLALALGYVVSIIVARYYGPEVVGLVALINALIDITLVFATLGTTTAVLRLLPEYVAKYSAASGFAVYQRIVVIVVALTLALSLLIYVFSGFIAEHIFSKTHLREMIALAAFFILFKSITAVNVATLRAMKSTKVFAIFQLLPVIANLAFLLPLTFYFYDKNVPVYIIFAVATIMALSSSALIYLRYRSMVRGRGELRRRIPYKELLSVSTPMLMTSVFFVVIAQTDVIMLGIIKTEAEVGVYSIASKIALAGTFVLQSVNAISAPNFAELYSKKKMEELHYIVHKSTKLIFLSTLPLLLGFIFCGYWLLMVFGERFTVAYPALIFLSLGMVVNTMTGSVGLLLNMTGHQKPYRNIVFIAAVMNIVLNLVLIPDYGVGGAAFSSMTAIIFWNITAAVYVRRVIGFSTSYIPFVTHGKM